MSKRSAWLVAIAVLVLLGLFSQRALRAWWDDDEGNRALLQGHGVQAARLFETGLALEPDWAMLHEDFGRALLASDPARALAEFDRAACGSPCLAQAGDALAAMGRTNEAIDRYVQAKAVEKVSQVAAQLVAAGRYDAALAVESALLAKLHNDFVDRSDLAAVYAQIGKIDLAAAARTGARGAARERAKSGLDALAHATALSPLNEDYLLSYGFGELRFGDRAAARQTFERILELHPGEEHAVEGLARTGGSTQP